MSQNLFGSMNKPKTVGSSFALGLAVIFADQVQRRKPSRLDNGLMSSAEVEFNTSSRFPTPARYTGEIFKLKVNYHNGHNDSLSAGAATTSLPWPTIPTPPEPDPLQDVSPWLKKNFTNPKQAYEYCMLVKEYCWEGNVDNGFRIWNNKVREWYHAPWIHYGPSDREPINCLTYERPSRPKELSATQDRFVQNWACGYYNAAGASVFRSVWRNSNDPQWNNDIKFPQGKCVFKIILTDATDVEVPSLEGSPSLDAVIANSITGESQNGGHSRDDFVSAVRLMQVDFAVRDDRAPIGWVFGTFMFDNESKERNPWDRIIPVGLSWGNDPKLGQQAYDSGKRVTESWINPRADEIRKRLGGSRPSFGWNGRMNGPVDKFVSACISCHSTSEKPPAKSNDPNDPATKMVPQPAPPFHDKATNSWRYLDDGLAMTWFRNTPNGQRFTPTRFSGDYSLQLQVGLKNYQAWLDTQNHTLVSEMLSRGTKHIVDRDPESRTHPSHH